MVCWIDLGESLAKFSGLLIDDGGSFVVVTVVAGPFTEDSAFSSDAVDGLYKLSVVTTWTIAPCGVSVQRSARTLPWSGIVPNDFV